VANQRGRRAGFLFVAFLITGFSCGGPPPQPPGGDTTATAAVASPLTAADRTHVARAAAYAAEVARYQQLAAQERTKAATYASWAPDPADRVTTNWNARLKTESEALAAGEDRLAADAQKAVDFHTAEAAKELAR
jgi:hypothetical protein